MNNTHIYIPFYDSNDKSYSKHAIYLGILGEKCVHAVLKRIYPKKKGFIVKHPEWNEDYPNDNSFDISVTSQDGKRLLDGEAKNWKKQPRTYGVDTVQKQIISRFITSTARLKILFISYLELLTEEAISLIQESGILIIELGYLITDKLSFIQTFNSLHKKLLSYLQPKQLSLTPLISSSSTPLTINNKSIIHNDNHTLNNQSKINNHLSIIYDTYGEKYRNSFINNRRTTFKPYDNEKFMINPYIS